MKRPKIGDIFELSVLSKFAYCQFIDEDELSCVIRNRVQRYKGR